MMRLLDARSNSSRWVCKTLVALSALSALSLGGCIVVPDRGFHRDGYYEGRRDGFRDGYRYRDRDDHRDGYYR